MGGQARRWCPGRWPANAPSRRSTARSRRFRGRRRRGWSTTARAPGAHPAAARRPAIASTCDATDTGRPERFGEHRSDGRIRPAQPRVVEVSGRAVDDAAGGHADPQRAAAVPAAQVAAGAAGQRRERGLLGAARRRRLDDVERAAEQVGGHDAGGARADVDAEREERFVVDLDRHPGPADGTGHREVGAFAQHTGVQQGGDLAVHRRDAQLGDLAMTSRAIGPRDAGGAEHRRGRGVGDAQRGRDDVVAGQQRALGVRCGRLTKRAGVAVVRTGDVLCRSRLVGRGHTWRLNRTARLSGVGQARRDARQQHARGEAKPELPVHTMNLARQLKLVR